MNNINGSLILRFIIAIASVQVFISEMESLFSLRLYSNAGLLNWSLLRKTGFKLLAGDKMLNRILDYCFSYPRVAILFAVRIILSFLTIVLVVLHFEGGTLLGISLLLNCILGLINVWRNTNSNNGSDQMTNIVMIAASIGLLGRSNGFAAVISILFIACQSELSYLTSGFFKLVHPGWRNGQSLLDIFSTATFGNRILKLAMDRRPILYKIGGNIVILGELLLGMAFIFPPHICFCLLGLGLGFHVAVAIIMGLNTFVWAFASTYPAVYFISVQLH